MYDPDDAAWVPAIQAMQRAAFGKYWRVISQHRHPADNIAKKVV